MKIHRIFLDLGMGGQKDFNIFCEKKIIEYCEKNNHEYFFWDDNKCLELLNKYPEYKPLYYNFKYGIMKVDFIRFLVLYDMGGLYVDCDVIINTDNIDTKESIGFLSYLDKDILDNGILYSEKNNKNIILFFEEVKKNIEEKNKISIYDSWKARYVFQTIGHRAVMRFFKKIKKNHYRGVCPEYVNLKNKKDLTSEEINNLIEKYKNNDFIILPSLSWVGV